MTITTPNLDLKLSTASRLRAMRLVITDALACTFDGSTLRFDLSGLRDEVNRLQRDLTELNSSVCQLEALEGEGN